MSKLLLLYTIFIVGILFLVLPETIEPVDYFLFSDMKLHFATHVYFIFEKLVLIILAYIIFNEASEYRFELKVFLWLMIADLADYLLCYNSIWFQAGDIPVSMNILKVLVFGLTILYAWINKILLK